MSPSTDTSDRSAAPTLYIIDGHAQIFRAYHAIRTALTSPVTGEPTQAVFGFAGMLLKLYEKFQPHYVVVAIDTPGKTFRDELYDQYKATREAPPEDFHQQVERIVEMTRLFGIPIIGMTGAEADDIIATITRQMLRDPDHPDLQIRVVSKDKDLEQLLAPRVSMFDIHTDTTIDQAALKQTKGITPDQVVDMLTLMGDKVDNIPGVDGIGPKTAAKLIEEFGSLDNLLANLDQIKGKRRENLEKAVPHLPLSRQLVQLKDDLELDFKLEDAAVGAIDAASLRRFFKEMGFRGHLTSLDRLLEAGQAPEGETAAGGEAAGTLFDMAGRDTTTVGAVADGEPLANAQQADYTAITTAKQLAELVETLQQQALIAVDTETATLGHRSQLCGISLSWQPQHGVYVPVHSPSPGDHLTAQQVIEALRPVLEADTPAKVGHNLKYDLLVLRQAGIELRGELYDTMVAAFLVGAPGRSLDDLAMALLRYETIPITHLIGHSGRGRTQKTMDCVPLDEMTPYAGEDADITLRLYQTLWPQIQAKGLEKTAREVEMPLVPVLAGMEWQGIRVDPQVLEAQKLAMVDRIAELRQEIQQAADSDFNPDSPRQLADVLFGKLGLPIIKRGKTGPSTDIEVLERLAEREGLTEEQTLVPRLIVEYRQLTKLVNTYLDALQESVHPDTRRVHASFHQTGTATGRLSSSDPNLQNIPIRTDIGRQIRKAFIADDGCRLICADYSQIELRMLAHLSQDPALIEAFRQDQDIHAAVAAQVFGVACRDVTRQMRAQAKIINFGIIYGVTPFGLARRIEGMDQKTAKALIDSYKQRFAGINNFLQDCIHQAKEQGYVSTILGRRRDIPQIEARNPQTRALGERLAINTAVQGSAADLIKLAMVNLHQQIEQRQLPLKLLLQIHDELVLEAPVDDAKAMAAIVCEQMEQAMQLRVPLKADAGIGENWLDCK